jgi:hypothetical protein
MRKGEHISKDFRAGQGCTSELEHVVLHDKEEVAVIAPEWFV